jgi:hypothetical protein|tara:strand:- start:2330 stop:2632 length:303 start_codon:yes stop_codon:yes gene_type:complete
MDWQKRNDNNNKTIRIMDGFRATEMCERTQQLQDLIPNNILEHYADQQRLNKTGVCAVFIMYNKEWAGRLFNEESQFSHEDILHDFIGLIYEDEHFVPRI